MSVQDTQILGSKLTGDYIPMYVSYEYVGKCGPAPGYSHPHKTLKKEIYIYVCMYIGTANICYLPKYTICPYVRRAILFLSQVVVLH